MMRIPYDVIIEKIKEKTSISEEEISSRIKGKMSQLAGLISKEGAAHIVANELGVKLLDVIEGKIKVKNIYPGMRSVETVGKITNLFELREFTKQDGISGKVASFVMADETGSIRVVLWNDQTDKFKELAVGKVVHIRAAYVKENNNNLELHVASKSQLIIDPIGETIGEVAQKQKPVRKPIDQLQSTDANIELLGTIVQIFDPHFYEVCPECNKRAKPKDNQFMCNTHGNVIPAYACVLNLLLDDGSSTIRIVFFRNQLANLLRMDAKDILKFKESPGEFQAIKQSMLGAIIKIVGRVSKNELFDRLEFVAQLVFPEPDPNEELKRLEKEATETIE